MIASDSRGMSPEDRATSSPTKTTVRQQGQRRLPFSKLTDLARSARPLVEHLEKLRVDMRAISSLEFIGIAPLARHTLEPNPRVSPCHIAYDVHRGRDARNGRSCLRDKYAEMLSMRALHASGEEHSPGAREPRARMAALAARFPGALREIDDLELDEIERRLEKVQAVIRDASEGEPWMEAAALFHALARGVLAVKRWLAGRRHVDTALEQAFADELEARALAEDARCWQGDLASVAAPPGGRITGLVFRRVGAHLGISEREARRLVFGETRTARRS